MNTAVTTRETTTSSAISTAAEYLTFRLGKEEYAVDILRVQEIRGYDEATRMANAPDYVKGVINLRGSIVPIIDLRMLFNLPDPSYDTFTVVIVLNVCGTVVGMVVDSVNDVVGIPSQELKPAPDFGSAVDTGFLAAIASLQDRMVMLVDMERLAQGTALANLIPHP
jgi:purine-binding chemotaxis protein CheW